MQTLFGYDSLRADIAALMIAMQTKTLYAIDATRSELMAKFDELKTSVEAYIAAVQAWAGPAQVDVQKAIDDAIAADDAGEEVDFQNLKDEVDAAFAKIPAAPVVPEPGPGASNL